MVSRTFLLALYILIATVVGAVTGSFPRRRAAFQLRIGNLARSKYRLTGFSLNGSQSNHRRSTITSLDAETSMLTSSLDSLKLIRGGGGALSLLNSIPIPTPESKSIMLASYLISACIFLLGTISLFAPVTYAESALKNILDNEIEEDSFDSSLLQSIGAIAIGFATHVYLALEYNLHLEGDGSSAIAPSLSHAMGYALLPRILLIAWSFLRARMPGSHKGEYQFEGTGFLKINFFMMSWTAFSLLTNAGNPAMSAKIFSTMALVKAMALVLQPVEMTQKIFGVDVSGKENSQSCFLGNILGYLLAVHAILMLSLSFGVDPIAAVVMTTVAWTMSSFRFLFAKKSSSE